MSMFVLVVDTSLMNVSISAVVRDLDTTVSSVQLATRARGAGIRRVHPHREQDWRALRPQACVRAGLLGYAVGALALAVAQGLTAIIVF
jgi:hypothetical protein